MKNKLWLRRLTRAIILILVLFLLSYQQILTEIGHFLVRGDALSRADAIVVLSTEIDYYPRLIEAADLYLQDLAEHVVINGNRKSESLRKLETLGFKPLHPWYSDSIAILKMLGVPEDRVLAISAEDVYDTISEAQYVGNALIQKGFSKVILTTSKFHTRRAGMIWESRYADRIQILVTGAREDPFQPKSWWKDGRQIRQVMSEYGAWIYFFWKKIQGSTNH